MEITERFKSLIRLADGRINGTLINAKYPDGVLYTLDPALGHIEKAEAGEWGDIVELDPATKNAHEATEARATFKAERTAQVAALTVTTEAGNEFDADEISQGRMARAILSMDDTEMVIWVLADNTAVEVAKAELIEALKLAGLAQVASWT